MRVAAHAQCGVCRVWALWRRCEWWGRADPLPCICVWCMQYLEANKDRKGLPKSKEAARPKTHWDFVIEEMAWLAKVREAWGSLVRGCVLRFRVWLEECP